MKNGKHQLFVLQLSNVTGSTEISVTLNPILKDWRTISLYRVKRWIWEWGSFLDNIFCTNINIPAYIKWKHPRVQPLTIRGGWKLNQTFFLPCSCWPLPMNPDLQIWPRWPWPLTSFSYSDLDLVTFKLTLVTSNFDLESSLYLGELDLWPPNLDSSIYPGDLDLWPWCPWPLTSDLTLW